MSDPDFGGVSKKLINWNAYVRAVQEIEGKGLAHAAKTASTIRGCMKRSTSRGRSIKQAAKSCLKKKQAHSKSRSKSRPRTRSNSRLTRSSNGRRRG